MPDEFYVGYAPHMPRGVARMLRRTVIAVAGLSVAAAAVLIFAQQPFARATFEYQQFREFSGRLETSPHPTLVVPRPGGEGASRYLLVAQGKHGADREVAPFAGRSVTLRGELIYRDGRTMIELASGSIAAKPGESTQPEPEAALGETILTGEIVDSKCYLGVMNPGRTKVHRDCAARCIRGGIPPMLVTADGSYLLTGAEVADFVGETVAVEGQAARAGDTLVLRAKKISRRE